MIRDSRRHICLAAAAWILGILLVYRPPEYGLFCGIPIAVFLGVFYIHHICMDRKRYRIAAGLGITVTLLILSAAVSSRQKLTYEQIQDTIQDQETITLQGVLFSKEAKNDRFVCRLRRTSCQTVLLYLDEDEIPIGAKVRVTGKIRCFAHATNEGQFDLADYYQYQNISFCMFPDEISVIASGTLSVREYLYQIQKQISHIFLTELNTRDAGILNTMVLGNRGMLDGEIKELYQEAGISHILAISGLHISILGIGIFRFLRKCRVSYPVSAGIGSAVILLYFLISGMGVSAQRATLMYFLLMGAEVLGRTYDPVNALAVAALVVLIVRPTALFQSGFLFSFLAMTSIVCFLPGGKAADKWIQSLHLRLKAREPYSSGKMAGRLTRWMFSFRQKLVGGVLLQLFLLPVTAWCCYEVPVFAVFLNLLVIPLCSWLLGCGLLGGLCGLVLPGLSKWIFIVCHVILDLYEQAIALTGRFPFSRVVTGKPEAVAVILYYLGLGSLCLCRRYHTEPGFRRIVRRSMVSFLGECRQGGRLVFTVHGHPARIWYGIIGGILLVSASRIILPPTEGFYITFLDVGQGDGICIADGRGRVVMIDGGSTSEDEIGTYRIEPYLKYHGIQNVDAWIITHGDYDHYSGCLELLESGYPVSTLILAEPMPQSEARAMLITAAQQNGTNVVFASEGSRIRLADCRMQCLYPKDTDTDDDPNALSQVWLLEKGSMRVLFTGDIGEDQEDAMLHRGLLTDLTVLKAAHHGSKYSSCEEFLDAVKPDYTVISCGRQNRYGHPHREALDRLEDSGSSILRTDEQGEITLYEKRQGYQIRWFCY